MVASPRETGYGCAIIATGVPVYFIFVSEDLITKPACVHKLLDSCTSCLQKVFVAVTPQRKVE